jgi:hypothetical protein
MIFFARARNEPLALCSSNPNGGLGMARLLHAIWPREQYDLLQHSSGLDRANNRTLSSSVVPHGASTTRKPQYAHAYKSW